MTKHSILTGCAALLSAVLCSCSANTSAEPGNADSAPSDISGSAVGTGYSLSDEDMALYNSRIIGQLAKDLMDLNPGIYTGFRVTFADLSGDDSAELILTMCNDRGNSCDYICTAGENGIAPVNSWHYPVLDGKLMIDSNGDLFNYCVLSMEYNGAEISIGYLTRYENSPEAYFDFSAVTADNAGAFIDGVDRALWRSEDYHFITDDRLEQYMDGSGYGLYAINMYNAIELDENATDIAIDVDLSTKCLTFTKQDYDRLMEKQLYGLADRKLPALSTDVISSPDGFDFSMLKDITL